MNFKEFLDKIEDLKAVALGGIDAQFKMAPELRLKYDANKIKANSPRKAAVLVLFYPDKNNNTRFLLTKRASYKGTHSAQISFPGGKTEESDNNLQETAVREAFEEVGVKSSEIKVIREITDVYIPPSNFLATPFLAITNNTPEFVTNHEVDKTIEVLIEELLDETNITTVELSTSCRCKW